MWGRGIGGARETGAERAIWWRAAIYGRPKLGRRRCGAAADTWARRDGEPEHEGEDGDAHENRQHTTNDPGRSATAGEVDGDGMELGWLRRRRRRCRRFGAPRVDSFVEANEDSEEELLGASARLGAPPPVGTGTLLSPSVGMGHRDGSGVFSFLFSFLPIEPQPGVC